MTIGSEAHDGVKFSDVIEIEEGKVRDHLAEVVRSSVQETLNGLPSVAWPSP